MNQKLRSEPDNFAAITLRDTSGNVSFTEQRYSIIHFVCQSVHKYFGSIPGRSCQVC